MPDLYAVTPGIPVPAAVRLGRGEFDVSHVALSNKGQDTLLVSDGFVAVADGSTPLNKADGGRVAAFAEQALVALRSWRHLSLRKQFDAAIRRVGGRYSAMDTPTCGVGLVQTRGSDLEVAALADVLVVVKQTGGVYTVLRDERVRPYDQRSEDAIAAMLGMGYDFATARRGIDVLLADQFHLHRNQPGGYWVFGNDTRAAGEVSAVGVPLGSVEAVLICSDGFARLFDAFGVIAGPDALIDAALSRGLDDLGRLLRDIESRDDSLHTYPRTSRHDDATAVLLRRRP